MKQETKQRIKHYSNIAQYIIIFLCWLVALVGITAYSVYWVRANNTEVVEPIKVDKKYASLSNYDNYNLKAYTNKTANYYISEQNGRYVPTDYNPYFTFGVVNNQQNIDVSVYANVDVVIDNVRYNDARVFVQFLIDNNFGYMYLYYRYIWIYDFNNNVLQYVYSYDSTYNLDISFVVYEVISCESNYSTFSEVYLGSTLDFVFNRVVGDDVVGLKINSGLKNATNYLLSFNRMSYSMAVYQVNYNLQIGYKLKLPFDFVSNGEVFDAIVIYPQYCYAYIDYNNQLKENYGQGFSIDQMPFVTSFIGYQYKGKNMSARQTPQETIGSKVYSYDSFSSFSGGVIAGQINMAGYYQVDDGNNFVYNYPIFDLSRGMIMNSKYDTIYFDSSVLDKMLPNTWWNQGGGSSPAPFVLPLDNITYNDAFSYFNYNGATDYVIYVSTDVGLDRTFGLLSTAFTGLTSFLSIQVLPGLSLGMLFFMPFLVGLIIIILRLVKK